MEHQQQLQNHSLPQNTWTTITTTTDFNEQIAQLVQIIPAFLTVVEDIPHKQKYHSECYYYY